MYLVVDKNKRTSRWEEKPAYFSSLERWGGPGSPILGVAFFPPLEKIAADLGVVPGREGILEVDFILRPINEVLDDGEVREEAGGETKIWPSDV